MSSSTSSAPLFIDAHVHLHDCFDTAQFLDAALTNFQQQRLQGRSHPVAGALLLAEVSGVNAFAERLNNQSVANWEICSTQEDHSRWAKHTDGHSILITAGRQVVTAEGIEVLALITAAAFADGLSLTETIEQIAAAGGLLVLPWGVGKWIGKRGKLVAHQLRTSPIVLFTGDNGGRPGFWALPDYFEQRSQLPGSDPLPLPNEVARAGSYGFWVQSELNEERPGYGLKQILLKPETSIQPYGRSLSLFQFIKNQTLIRAS